MLSYQHAYHAGSLADVHKHALLAWMLAYMTRKDKPLSYIETHAGRGLYDLDGAEAAKTGEAAAGIRRAAPLVAPDHPYRRRIDAVRKVHGATAYPGSPVVAAGALRTQDTVTLAELHPAEHAALIGAMAGTGARVMQADGLALALSITPPTPRRGLLLCDPSYEIKADYDTIARWLPKVHARWNVGVLMLWYPVLPDNRHRPMVRAIATALPDAMIHEVAFAPARAGHGMQGSGVVVVNPPFGLAEETVALDRIFAQFA